VTKMTPEVPNKLFYKIGEVCELTDTQPYVLRFWESEFPQLAPRKNRSGQRVYQRKDIDTVLRIKKLLYDEEYTIAGARKKLDEESPAPAVENPAPPRQARAAAAAPPRTAARPRQPEHEHPVDMLAARLDDNHGARPQAKDAVKETRAPGVSVEAASRERLDRLQRSLDELGRELRVLLDELRQEP
jgi:DNA-binding transcriptional MerR regulator